MNTLLEAREYLDGLQEDAGHDNVVRWREEILQAEQARTEDRKVMDIYKARVIRVQNETDETDEVALSALEQWMDFALVVEEKQ